jgi:heterodisulfide reductase subunit D
MAMAEAGGISSLRALHERCGEGTKEAERWAQVCTNTGKCIPACAYGINPRFMVIAAKAKLGEHKARRAANEYFKSMGRSTLTIARLQLPPEVLARVAPRCGPPKNT